MTAQLQEVSVEILREAGSPLHCKEITRRAVKRGLLTLTGKRLDQRLRDVLTATPDVFYQERLGIYGLLEWNKDGKRVPSISEWRGESLGMTVRDATIRVLREADESLHFQEITRRALEAKLFTPQKSNPHREVQTALMSEEDVFYRDKSRYGSGVYGLVERKAGSVHPDFSWIPFYEEFAGNLLAYRDDRIAIVDQLRHIGQTHQVPMVSLEDEYPMGTKVPLEEMCPFTTYTTFNRGLTDANRIKIASALGKFLEVKNPAPESFDGIPIALNQNSLVFPLKYKSEEGDVDKIWSFFAAALAFADDSGDVQKRQDFISAYDSVLPVKNVGKINLTMGLFWMRPRHYLSLDKHIQTFVEEKFPNVGDILKRGETGEGYLALVEDMRQEIQAISIGSFPELSYEAYMRSKRGAPLPPSPPDPNPGPNPPHPLSQVIVDLLKETGHPMHSEDVANQILERGDYQTEAGDFHASVRSVFVRDINDNGNDSTFVRIESDSGVYGLRYSVGDIIDDGWFGTKDELARALSNFGTKQNLILQGPPGTGKTWLAKRLAHACAGYMDKRRILPVQFHPNMSYEDFVMGWRPTGDDGENGEARDKAGGVRLELAKGPMMQMVHDAKEDPDAKYFLVIEEINRGNPAQIFGEMLTLMEASKREKGEALRLVHQRAGDEKVYVPPNLYIIGTMNLADRSLAMVDYALRRRFAFFPMRPNVNDTWREWMEQNSNLSSRFLRKVGDAMIALNKIIEDDPNLGEDYRIGHSYVTEKDVKDPSQWYRDVVKMEIEPLLHEYWYDETSKVEESIARLLSIDGDDLAGGDDVSDEGEDETGGDDE